MLADNSLNQMGSVLVVKNCRKPHDPDISHVVIETLPRTLTHENRSEGPLGLRWFIGGNARYIVDGLELPLDAASVLVTNTAQEYTVQRWASEDNRSLLFFFSEEDCRQAVAAKYCHDPELGCTPRAIELSRRVYSSASSFSGQLRWFWRALQAPEVDGLAVEQQFQNLLANLVDRSLEEAGLPTRLEATSPAVQAENYRRATIAADYARCNLHLDLSILELSRVACMSRAHFIRSFTQAFGIAPNKFVRELRLKKAAWLLRRSDMPVGFVCRAVGFESVPSFTTLFQRRFGQTPSQYRQV